ncbi:Beta-TrCP [Fusarium oxysporum f. sp. albedinis]|nr:Beta-TrCP [Fusarium oxysporum f. sp. albedinis]
MGYTHPFCVPPLQKESTVYCKMDVGACQGMDQRIWGCVATTFQPPGDIARLAAKSRSQRLPTPATRWPGCPREARVRVNVAVKVNVHCKVQRVPYLICMPNTWVGAVRISAFWGVKALDAGRTTGRTHADSKREKVERSAP